MDVNVDVDVDVDIGASSTISYYLAQRGLAQIFHVWLPCHVQKSGYCVRMLVVLLAI